MKVIINGKIIQKDCILENKVLVFDKKIIDICDKVPENCEVIDAKEMYISPGLIDIHIHGSKGSDTMDGSLEAINIISNSIIEKGVTSYLPTTMAMDKECVHKAFGIIKKAINNGSHGATVLGVHMEGPFINEYYKGAQNSEFIIKPSFEFIKDYTDIIKIISYAPEVDKDFEFTKDIKKNTDIILSICHTNSTYENAKAAIELGVSNITHLFNAMSPLNHRDPGVVGAALMTDVYCELIADKIHTNKDIFQFVLDNKGKEKIILVTDSMRAGCMEDGEYELGGQVVYVKENSARLKNGTLAGSVLTLNKAVYNFFESTNLKIHEAIALASINPAKSINIENKKGSLDIGKDADISLFDENMNCYLTIVEGKEVFNKII